MADKKIVRFGRRTLLVVLAVLPAAAIAQQQATGVVFHDRNGNGVRDGGEEGLPGIGVSDGERIVDTDDQGRWSLPVDDDVIYFVIKPRGWMTPVNHHQLPQFHYIHKPQGTPHFHADGQEHYEGVAPTGPLPAAIDFPLQPQQEPERFEMIVFADPQPRNIQEVQYATHDVIEEVRREVAGTDAALGVTLGDIAFNNLDTFEPLNAAVALIGLPWYNVIGNHDHNQDAPNDKVADDTFERHYGPSYYSFDYGPVHFIALDDVHWNGVDGNRKKERYTGGLGPRQLAFVKADLARVPDNQLVVLMMHIPLSGSRGWKDNDREELFKLIQQRPHCISISGHTHTQMHHWLDPEDGWMSDKPHHHIVNVTVSGSWWSGAPDEEGIPHTIMKDGAPNGYAIMTFDGADYDWRFKAARRPADDQMSIYAPEAVRADDAATTEVVVNIYGGHERTRVEMRVGEGEWRAMEKVDRVDPYFTRLKAIEDGPNPPAGRKLPALTPSTHLWAAQLPAGLEPGTRQIEIRATNERGRVDSEGRSIRILP